MSNQKGQILVPALFVFPSLVLFAILIVEIAKLSQQKVLMQFAMDTSVFMESSQASDMANRFAYLNSPWPTRIFQQADGKYINWPLNKYDGSTVPGRQNIAEVWFRNGVYPSSIENPDPSPPSEGWNARFRATVPSKNDKDTPDSDLIAFRNSLNTERPPEDLGTLIPFTYQDIDDLSYPDQESAQTWYSEIYGHYSRLYQLATMVKLVYERLHSIFYEKTFWLNTGFKTDKSLVPPHMHVNEHKTKKIKLWYTVQNNPLSVPIPYYNEGEIQGGGLWQLGTVSELAEQTPSHTFNFGKHYYKGPANHFGIDYRDLFNGYDPYVTASAEVSGGHVWPNSKPTFQVRLRP